MFVDGAWAEAGSGATFTAESPATGETIAEVPEGDREDAQRAIAAANRAAAGWANAGAFERAAAMHRVADEVERHRPTLEHMLTLDQGKPLSESRDEVEELVQYWRNAAEDGKRLEGRVPNSISAGKRVLLLRRPRGVDRRDHALELALHDARRAHCARARVRQHRRVDARLHHRDGRDRARRVRRRSRPPVRSSSTS